MIFIEKLSIDKAKEIIYSGKKNVKLADERWKTLSDHYGDNCELWTYQDFTGYGIAIKTNNKTIKKIELMK